MGKSKDASIVKASQPADQAPAEGGSYIIQDGVRTRVEDPTQDHPDGNMSRDAEGRPVDRSGKPIDGAKE